MNENYKIVSDYEMWVKYFVNGESFEFIDTIVSNFDVNGISSDIKKNELHEKERNEVISKYFTQEQIEIAKNAPKTRHTFFELLFSIKNNHSNTHKILTIFGLPIRIRRKTVLHE